jgi:hypothetical protein
MLYLVGVHEVRWDEVGTKSALDYTCFNRKRIENHELGAGFFAKRTHVE